MSDDQSHKPVFDARTDIIPVGTVVWNRYDLKWGVVVEEPRRGDELTSWDNWHYVEHGDGDRNLLDYPQRMVPENDYRAGLMPDGSRRTR